VVDNLLLYVTGGGVGQLRSELTSSLFRRHGNLADRTRWGGVVGVGRVVMGRWLSIGASSSMVPKDEVAFTSAFFDPGDVKNFTSLDSIWTSRIGLTYRFGGDVFGKRPVSARY
jgi:hypothetical protein